MRLIEPILGDDAKERLDRDQLMEAWEAACRGPAAPPYDPYQAWRFSQIKAHENEPYQAEPVLRVLEK